MTQPSKPSRPVRESLSDYGPPPPPQSAYPSPEEGGFEAGFTAEDGYGPPGPGYTDGEIIDDAEASGTDQDRGSGTLLPIAMGVCLALVLVLGLVLRPIEATVVAGLVLIGAAVVAIWQSGTVRRMVLISAAGPVLVLTYYWVSALLRSGSG